MRRFVAPTAQRGALMIEVLVTIVICIIGLWGLVEIQSRLQVSEMESYQRSQALMLLDDMSSRIEINRGNAAAYVTGAGSPYGVGMTCPTTNATLVQRDVAAWCASLQGAAETTGGTNVGAMIGARGCIENIGVNQYMITVAWQGLIPLAAPPASVACGAGSYNTAGTDCINDLCRRAITTVVRIADLST